jgi:hypothetical protein
MYLSLERLRKETSSREGMSPNTVLFVSEAENIHNKMIFDAVNEALNDIRNRSLAENSKLPWSVKPITHSRPHVPELIQGTILQVEDWSSIEAGKIPNEELILSNGVVDEEGLQMIREEKLATILAQDVMTMEEQWVDYEMEETQVKVDLSDVVMDELVREVVELLGMGS